MHSKSIPHKLKRKENYNKFLQLRQDFPIFEYQSYSIELKKQILEITYCFNISNKYKFKPKITIPNTSKLNWDKLKTKDMNNMVFHIGMIELVSYWKATCSPTISIKPHKLNDDQVNWWKKLYFHGLGEFFYLNGIEPDRTSFLEIKSEGSALEPIDIVPDNEEIIVPVGGGKDSVVTLELLKKNNYPVLPMALNPRAAIKRTIVSAGFDFKNSIVVNRTIDPLLLELNEQGFLNGHTPFSALLAFINVLCVSLSGSSMIALSNENSANQSTIPGTKINHQYSKSFEFEQDFRSYINESIHPNIKYFSFLRPLNELQITRLFSQFPWHFKGFRSCNVGSKEDVWCGHCPKCLFTDIMLSPFLSVEQRCEIFGNNLLNDPHLEPIFNELIGKTAIKPFECVGTPEEINATLYKLSKKLNESEYPFLLKRFLEYNYHDQNDFDKLMRQFDSDHFIPDHLVGLLKQSVDKKDKGFINFLKKEFVGIKNILILGYGREGRSSARLLKKYFPGIKLAVADKNPKIESQEENNTDLVFYTGENYLDALSDYDLVIKSPGIKLDQNKSHQRISSQTALFLKYFRNQTIGITGTKGKSTTASLTHHILKNAEKKVMLLGNIGIPAFDHIDDISEDSIIVYELSAHQLQGIEVSPHIAVLLNIFPEHLDHFDSVEQYSNAKWNIAKYQTTGDFLIIKSDHKDFRTILNAEVIEIDQKIIDKESNSGHIIASGLKGDHNLINITAAIEATALLGIGRKMAIQSIRTFKSLPHRLEFVGTFRGIKFYNDSISTVPESTIAAVRTLQEVKTLLLGGFDRGLDYSSLTIFLKKSEITTFILLGGAGKKMYDMLKMDPNPNQKYVFIKKLNDAFETIKLHTPAGSICLLSPAAASYDQFHNFEHRGDTFKSLVKSLT